MKIVAYVFLVFLGWFATFGATTKSISNLAQSKAAVANLNGGDAEASAIRKVAEATKDAQSSPTFMRLRELEVEMKRIEKWDGHVPSQLIETGGNTGLSMFLQQPK